MVLLCFFARTRGGLGGKTERVVGTHSNPIAAAAATAADLLSLAGANGAAEIDAEASSITRVKCACEASSAAGKGPNRYHDRGIYRGFVTSGANLVHLQLNEQFQRLLQRLSTYYNIMGQQNLSNEKGRCFFQSSTRPTTPKPNDFLAAGA
jgi:hypothetical protein